MIDLNQWAQSCDGYGDVSMIRYNMTVYATDSAGLTDEGVIRVRIVTSNQRPSFDTSSGWDSATVAEGAATGTSVTTAVASDADGDGLTYSIEYVSSLPFTIDSSTGEVTVDDDIDYESNPSYTVTVIVTDDGEGAMTEETTLTVTVTDVNEPPTMSTPADSNINEDATVGSLVFSIEGDDPDDGDDSALTYVMYATPGTASWGSPLPFNLSTSTDFSVSSFF